MREKHDEIVAAGYVEATLKDGTFARGGIRKDRHTLLTAVAFYPLLTAQIADDATARKEYERWAELNVRWLKDTFGDQLVSVIEHVDEEHPHRLCRLCLMLGPRVAQLIASLIDA